MLSLLGLEIMSSLMLGRGCDSKEVRESELRGIQKVGNVAGDLARLLLPLKVGTTHKALLLAFLTSTFFIRWV